MRILIFSFISIITTTSLFAQPERWQQHIKYNIDVKVDAANNKFSGIEKFEYANNSPDTLNKIFVHLYWNAFQPNSGMDMRSRELGKIGTRKDRAGNPLPDWDGRVTDRISKLSTSEQGYQKVSSVKILELKLRSIIVPCNLFLLKK